MSARFILRGSGSLILGALALMLLFGAASSVLEPASDIGIGAIVVTCILMLTASVSFMILCVYLFRSMRKAPQKTEVHAAPRAEDRLDELERLKRRDMVTPEEYTTKRQEILKDL